MNSKKNETIEVHDYLKYLDSILQYLKSANNKKENFAKPYTHFENEKFIPNCNETQVGGTKVYDGENLISIEFESNTLYSKQTKFSEAIDYLINIEYLYKYSTDEISITPKGLIKVYSDGFSKEYEVQKVKEKES